MSLNTFSHTFHYVTRYTDPDPTIDINIPHSLHLTDTCRKLDFETCQDLHTNTRGMRFEFHMSWLASLTVSNITPVQRAVFVIWGKKQNKNPNGKTIELTQ